MVIVNVFVTVALPAETVPKSRVVGLTTNEAPWPVTEKLKAGAAPEPVAINCKFAVRGPIWDGFAVTQTVH